LLYAGPCLRRGHRHCVLTILRPGKTPDARRFAAICVNAN
jgi:hypothetical protein